MRKLLTILFSLLATAMLWAKDYDFIQDDLYYRITIYNTLEVGNTKKDITSIVIPSTVNYEGTSYRVTHIGHSAFHLCSSLTSVTIPESVTSIGDEAFKTCTSLLAIYYTATKQQWKQVIKGNDWNKDIPTRVVYCLDGAEI